MRTRAYAITVVGTFVIAAIVATVLLGNMLGSKSCNAGWTGYVRIGDCPTKFWPPAFLLGPIAGLIVSAAIAYRAMHWTPH